MLVPHLSIDLPSWVSEYIAGQPRCDSPERMMRLAISLSRENVERGTGGPFGAAVFDEATAELVAVGVNSVERLGNSVLHAEVMAIMFADASLGGYSFRSAGGGKFVLAASCEPCAMCLGAILWSGATRLLCGAGRDDAVRIGFDEGPVFPESFAYLEHRGIEVIRGLLRNEAAAVLDDYRARGGHVYNA